MNLYSLARSGPARRELLARRISDERWHVDDARAPHDDLDPPPVVRRDEKQRPGEVVHVDIKKLARFARAGNE